MITLSPPKLTYNQVESPISYPKVSQMSGVILVSIQSVENVKQMITQYVLIVTTHQYLITKFMIQPKKLVQETVCQDSLCQLMYVHLVLEVA